MRLGYPADSKLLIINADDLAMSHSENDASFTALDQKLVTSATVMDSVWDAAWRQRDLDVISSPEFRQALVDNHIIVIGWRPIQRLIRD